MRPGGTHLGSLHTCRYRTTLPPPLLGAILILGTTPENVWGHLKQEQKQTISEWRGGYDETNVFLLYHDDCGQRIFHYFLFRRCAGIGTGEGL